MFTRNHLLAKCVSKCDPFRKQLKSIPMRRDKQQQGGSLVESLACKGKNEFFFPAGRRESAAGTISYQAPMVIAERMGIVVSAMYNTHLIRTTRHAHAAAQ